ncbi:DUF4215 domain-containing protein [Candidatus Woesearchaeota archaeon]|nr:DUF4215 domain-containing protein [Candidatus Woesearchaeota archaeon]
MRTILYILISVALMSSVLAASMNTTDIDGNLKYDFQPSEKVYIHGIGFDGDSAVNITVVRPDGAMESCTTTDCHWRFVDGLQTTDAEGAILYVYDLDGIVGNYSINATDGTNYAYTTFTDARIIAAASVNGSSFIITPPSGPVSVSVSVITFGILSANDWESTSYRIGNSGPFTCVDHSDFVSTGLHTTSFTITAPGAFGTYDLQLRAYQNDACSQGESNTLTLNNAIIVQSPALCGNSIIELPETCDDGNTNSSDGCNSICQTEQGWGCNGQPSICVEDCGDGLIVGDEECDDSNNDDDDGCSSICEVEDGWQCNDIPSECTTINPEIIAGCGYDVALIIDSSLSTSNTQLNAVKSSLNNFVDMILPYSPSEIAVIDLGSTGTLVQDYTNDTTAIHNAINSLTIGGFTNWQDALNEAHQQFNNRIGNNDLYIFASEGGANAITDIPLIVINPIAEAFAVEEADGIKLDGVSIVTIGVGGSPDAAALSAISSPEQYFTLAGFGPAGNNISQLINATCTYCGDGITQSPNDYGIEEECDDGNNIDGDGCSSTCQDDGVISVCKIIINPSNQVTAGSPNENFSIDTSFGSFDFNTPLALNTSLTNQTGNDAQCINVTGLALGNYTYDPEIYTNDIWLTPRYHDNLASIVTINVPDAMTLYGNADRSDGIIELTTGHAVLGILNQYCQDTDLDRICDDVDNCVFNANPGQEDEDDDRVGDVCDLCADSPNQPVDADGCTQIQFCRAQPLSCGDGCDSADWMDDEQNNDVPPYDCMTTIVANEGTFDLACVAIEVTCLDND